MNPNQAKVPCVEGTVVDGDALFCFALAIKRFAAARLLPWSEVQTASASSTGCIQFNPLRKALASPMTRVSSSLRMTVERIIP